MAIAPEEESQVNLWPYVVLFVILYYVASVIVTAIESILDLSRYAGANFGIMIAAAVMPVRRFVLDHRRHFNPHEQRRFALLSLIASFAVDLALLLLVVALAGGLEIIAPFADELNTAHQEEGHVLPIIPNATIVMFLGLFALWYLALFAVLYFAAGVFSRFFSRRLAEKGKI